MEELSKREIEESRDHRNRMNDREKVVVDSPKPRRGCRQREAGNANGAEQDQREEVHPEGLSGLGPLVAHPAPERKEDSCQHHDGRDVQAMKDEPGKDGSNLEGGNGKAEHVGDVGHLIIGSRSELNPSEDQRESERNCQQASPEDQLVHPPSHT